MGNVRLLKVGVPTGDADVLPSDANHLPAVFHSIYLYISRVAVEEVSGTERDFHYARPAHIEEDATDPPPPQRHGRDDPVAKRSKLSVKPVERCREGMLIYRLR